MPDETFQHDFYKVANEIVNLPELELKMTIHGDDICLPCNRYDGWECTDPLGKVKGYSRKETYNQQLDRRLMQHLGLDADRIYTVKEMLEIIGENKNIIFQVWTEEDPAAAEKRNLLFWMGHEKMCSKWMLKQS